MRIIALEKEVQRYKTQIEAQPVEASGDCSVPDLLQKIDTLEKVCSILHFLR